MSHLLQIPQLMVTYGKLLMNELPDETTEFISEVCKEKGLSFPLPRNVLDYTMNCFTERAEPSDYLHIFVNKPQHLLKFLEKMVTVSYEGFEFFTGIRWQPHDISSTYHMLLYLIY